MAASVKISGSTYTYTISNIQNAITCTPGNRNSRYGFVYACPTVTRNKTGEAFTRYFMYEVSGASSGQTLDYEIALYKAVFTKTGKTATVTEVTSESVATLGRLAYVKINRTWSPSLVVSAGTSASSFWDNASTSVSITLSGWNPATPSISYTLSQSSLDASIFGYVKGFCSAQWKASGGTTWDISNGTISPTNTINLSANGTTASNSGTGSRTATLAYKTLSTTSVTGTAKITNNIGGSATSTATVNVQSYSKPIAKSLAIGRVKQNNEDHATMSIGWAVDILNKQSNVTQSITSGDVSCTWECEDLSNPDTVFSSGTFNIVNDGEAMTKTTDTTPPIVLVDASGNNHNDYDPDKSFKFTAYITDRIGESSLSITAVLASEFYLICAREGGRGIGFGMVPPDDAMHVYMPATFYDNVEMTGDGVAIGTTATDGKFTISNDLIPSLRGSADQGTAVTWRTVYEDAPYGDMAIEFGVGTGATARGIWCTAYNGGAGHWMINENAAGEVFIQGKKVRGSTRVWSGGLHMTASHSATWTDDGLWSSVSLVWSAYNGGAIQNYQFLVYTVPRAFIANHPGVGHTIFMGGSKYYPMGCKYVYISLNKVSGNDDNNKSGTSSSGITYANASYVLREVWLNY